MTRRTRFATLAVALLALLTASVPGCSKSSTNPGGGGGAAKEMDSPTINQGGMYAHTFANVGTYPYHCKFHGAPGSGMSGTVVVANGQPASAAVSIINNSFGPASVQVGPGGTVTWTSSGSNSHTVTSD